MLPRWASSDGPMPFEDFGVEVLALAAADAVDEVAEMRGPCSGCPEAGTSFDRLALVLALGKELAVLDHAFVGVELVGDLAVLSVDQPADLEEQLGVAEVDDGQLGVGRLALVLVAEAAAEADDALAARRRRAWPSGRCPSGATPWLPISPLPKSQNQCQL